MDDRSVVDFVSRLSQTLSPAEFRSMVDLAKAGRMGFGEKDGDWGDPENLSVG